MAWRRTEAQRERERVLQRERRAANPEKFRAAARARYRVTPHTREFLAKKSEQAKARYAPRTNLKNCPACNWLGSAKAHICQACGHAFYPDRTPKQKTKKELQRISIIEVWHSTGMKLYEHRNNRILFFVYYKPTPNNRITTYKSARRLRVAVWGYSINGGVAFRDFDMFITAYTHYLANNS